MRVERRGAWALEGGHVNRTRLGPGPRTRKATSESASLSVSARRRLFRPNPARMARRAPSPALLSSDGRVCFTLRMTNVVWVVGATGLVGGHVVDALLDDPRASKVITWVRTKSDRSAAKLEQRSIDFERLEEAYADAGPGAAPNLAVCALGTTIKTAGSRARFRRVDYDYVLAFARAAKKQGARALAVVSALGADPHSRIFYNRVKGEVEQALGALGFETLIIARPSLLLGERRELRLGERLMGPISRLLPASVRGIEAKTVAQALVRTLFEGAPGQRVVSSAALQELGAPGSPAAARAH